LLHFAHYNSGWVHQTLRVTPAMAAGVADKVLEMSELVAVVEAADARPNRLATYQKRLAA
jgi:hypothetical protein